VRILFGYSNSYTTGDWYHVTIERAGNTAEIIARECTQTNGVCNTDGSIFREHSIDTGSSDIDGLQYITIHNRNTDTDNGQTLEAFVMDNMLITTTLSTPASDPTYFIGTQPDSATNPLAVIDELHVHADAEETVVDKAYDRGSAEFTQVGANIPFTTEGAQKTFADTTVVAGDAPIYKISSYNLLGETPLMSLVQGLTVQLSNAPTNLAASSTVNADIQLSWTASTDLGGGTLLDYELQRRTPPTTGTWITVNNPTTTSYLDTNVNTGTIYEYQVATNNEAGTGAYSSPVSQQAGIPPDPPTLSTVVISDPNNQPMDHTLTWTAPSNTGTAAITHYGITLSVANNSSYTTVVPNTGNVLTYTYSVSNIQPNTDYYYKVVAVSSHGTSNDSNEVSVTTPNVPDQVSPIPTLAIEDPDNFPLKIKVSWTAPNDGGSVLKSYKIDRWDAVGGWSTIVATTGNTDLFHEDTAGVVQDTEYKYTVGATNSLGTGAMSNESLGITTPSVPGIPSLTLAINNPNPSPLVITATFVAPGSDGGSAITGYNLYHSTDDITFNQVGSAPITTATHDHTVTAAGTHYYKAEAVNTVGTGQASTSFNIATPSIPSAPTNPTSAINDIVNAPIGCNSRLDCLCK